MPGEKKTSFWDSKHTELKNIFTLSVTQNLQKIFNPNCSDSVFIGNFRVIITSTVGNKSREKSLLLKKVKCSYQTVWY